MYKINILCNSCRTYIMLWRITNNENYKNLALRSLWKAKKIYKKQNETTVLLKVG